jgi:hypothetical protein
MDLHSSVFPCRFAAAGTTSQTGLARAPRLGYVRRPVAPAAEGVGRRGRRGARRYLRARLLRTAARMRLTIFGLTVSSSWGNGHATLWRALIRALARQGHAVTFFERDVPVLRRAPRRSRAPRRELVLVCGLGRRCSPRARRRSPRRRGDGHVVLPRRPRGQPARARRRGAPGRAARRVLRPRHAGDLRPARRRRRGGLPARGRPRRLRPRAQLHRRPALERSARG